MLIKNKVPQVKTALIMTVSYVYISIFNVPNIQINKHTLNN